MAKHYSQAHFDIRFVGESLGDLGPFARTRIPGRTVDARKTRAPGQDQVAEENLVGERDDVELSRDMQDSDWALYARLSAVVGTERGQVIATPRTKNGSPAGRPLVLPGVLIALDEIEVDTDEGADNAVLGITVAVDENPA